MSDKITKQQEIESEEKYVAFLKKRLESPNYRANVSKEEVEKTMAKYDKAKLRLRLMKMDKK
jgi:hypothetical protein